MGSTVVEKVIAAHAGRPVAAGDVVWMACDVRSARDFGGASVVEALESHCPARPVDDPQRTFFTFDCNAPATTTGYADNQQLCRGFARRHGVRVYDVDAGIGSHVMLEQGLVMPGSVVVGTDSHLNIMGAVGSLGQGMGDADVAYVWCSGRTWFEVPETLRVTLSGTPGPAASPKDLTLAVLRRLGTKGALGRAVELAGPAVDALTLSGRITLASMATEMGAIAAFIPPSREVLSFCRARSGVAPRPVLADPGASYAGDVTVDVDGLAPQVARPGSPADVVDAATAAGSRVDSAIIGSCTNGRYEDMAAASALLKGRRVADGFVLKVVPATAEVYDRMLATGLVRTFRRAGALVHNPGCGGCAAGQAGIIGRGEVQASTSNRNFAGKQGAGDTWLCSPATAAATAIAGALAVPPAVPLSGVVPDGRFGVPRRPAPSPTALRPAAAASVAARPPRTRPTVVPGRAFPLVRDDALIDDIDTDMIFHNRHLHITSVAEMGRFALGNLEGFADYPSRSRPGDVLVVGRNFGAGSSRAQAVDCFRSLGVGCIVGRSFGAIWLRNAINSGLPVIECPGLDAGFASEGDALAVDLDTGRVSNEGRRSSAAGKPMLSVAMDIYQAGGIFNYALERV